MDSSGGFWSGQVVQVSVAQYFCVTASHPLYLQTAFQIVHIHYGRMYGYTAFRGGICQVAYLYGCGREFDLSALSELHNITESAFRLFLPTPFYNGVALPSCDFGPSYRFNAAVEYRRRSPDRIIALTSAYVQFHHLCTRISRIMSAFILEIHGVLL